MDKNQMRNKEAGFTFIEMVVTAAVTGILMLIIVSIYQSNTDLWLKSDQKREVQQNARIALQRMISDIRQAGYVYGNSAAGNGSAISVAADNLITFNAVVRDANHNGVKDNAINWAVNQDTETITFSIPAGTNKIRRTSVRAGGVTENMDITFPAVKVTGLDFEYLNSTGAVLSTPVSVAELYAIRYIELVLQVQKGEGKTSNRAGKETITLKGGVSPPNLR